ncbi:MAG: hypothetical protein E7497_08030 [Ruminococcus sp.]|nr:hypothetical protein [Ruminococcus sp.]
MFKQVQWKFFAITTSLLLAVLIAALASINLIMQAVMQHQSQVVLKQIAASVEYDDATSTFTYFPEFDGGKKPPEISDGRHGDKPMGSPADHIEDMTAPQPTTTVNIVTDAAESSTETASPTESETEANIPVPPTEATKTEPATVQKPQISETRPAPEPHEESTKPAVTTSAKLPPHKQTATKPITPPITAPHPTAPSNPTVTTTASPHTPPIVKQTTTRNLPPESELPTPPHSHESEQKPTEDYQYPTFEYPKYPYIPPFHWHDYPNWAYNNGYYYIYPQPDCRYDEDWNNPYCEPTEPSAQEPTEVYTKPYNQYDSNNSCSGNEKEMIPLAGGNTPVLDGFTVADGVQKRVMAADKSSPTLNNEPIPKSLGSIDFFILMADEGGNFVASLNNEVLNADSAQKYVSAIISDGAANGMLNSYQFCSSEKGNGTIMVFTDKSSEMDMLDQLSRTSILIGVVGFIVLSAIAFFLSKKSIEPVKVAFEKQKQFISDASHELKTPLTIISTNADVLSEEIGCNKWLTYIQSQAERMNVLVNDLLNLTRLENNTSDFIKCEFDLSKAVENTVLPFECRAFEENRKLEIDIQDGLTVSGSERHIKQMAAIFIDNALKYSDENGTVRVSLSLIGDKKVFSVFNTGAGIKESDKDKIFERFYRSDDSRSRMTGGYGLGLPIAKSIIDKHKFRVSIENHEGHSICFTVTM